MKKLTNFLKPSSSPPPGEKKAFSQQCSLHTVVSQLEPEVARAVLDSDTSSASVRDQEGRTPLHSLIIAASKQPERRTAALEILRAILSKQAAAQLDVHDQEWTPLLLAIHLRQEDLAHALLVAGFNPAQLTRTARLNALQLALAPPGLPTLVPRILQAAQSQAFTSELINNISQDGSSALHTIAANYQTGALAELLRYRSRCNLDLQDSKGYTPLHRIILGLLTQKAPRAALPMALDLLDAGCRIDIPSASQQTAIALAVDLADLAGVDAAHRGQDKVLRAMAAGRGTVVAGSTAFNVIGPRGLAPVHVAARMGRVEVITQLVQRGAKIDMLSSGALASVIAAKNGQRELLTAMFEHLGADPLAVDGRGSSALGHILLNKSTSWTDADIIALLTTALRHVRDKNALATFLAAVHPTYGPLPLLHLACAMGHLDVAHILLRDVGVPSDSQSPQGLTPLAVARKAAELDPQSPYTEAIVQLLTGASNSGGPLSEQGSQRELSSPGSEASAALLSSAMDAGKLEAVMTIVRKNTAYVNTVSQSGATPLYLALVHGNVECARELVSHLGADTGSQERYMPLHVAVGTRNLQLVQLILSTEQGQVCVNSRDAASRHPTVYLWNPWSPSALNIGHVPISGTGRQDQAKLDDTYVCAVLSELIKFNCDVNISDPLTGRRPLHWAVQLSSPSMVQALAKSPTLNPNLTDTEDFTALHRAVLTDKPAAVQAMLESLPQLDLNVTAVHHPTSPQATPLHIAIAEARTPLATLLINDPRCTLDTAALALCMNLISANKRAACATILTELLRQRARLGFDLSKDWRADEGMGGQGQLTLPPLHMAAQHDDALVLRMLVVDGGAAVDQLDSQGRTALHLAVSCKAYAAVSELVTLGADICAAPPGSLTTPLTLACQQLDARMVTELLSSTAAFDVNTVDGSGSSALGLVYQTLVTAVVQEQRQVGVASVDSAHIPDLRVMSAPVEGISNLTQPSRSYKPQDSGGSLPPLHHFASEAIVYNPSMSVSMGVKLDELPVNQYPCAVMPAEDFAKLARHVQIRAQGLPEPAVTIFLDLLQCGADINRPYTTQRALLNQYQRTKSSDAGTSIAGSPAHHQLVRSMHSSPTVHNGERDSEAQSPITPLLAAILLQSVRLVDMLVLIDGLELAGRPGIWPQCGLWPLQVAIDALKHAITDMVVASEMLGSGRALDAFDSGGSYDASGGSSSLTRKSPFVKLLGKLTASSKSNRSATAAKSMDLTAPEGYHTALRILTAVAFHPRTPLNSGPHVPLLQQLTELAETSESVKRDVQHLIHELVQSGRDASVNFVDPLTGRTALHTAAEGGMSSLVVQLGMAPGVDVNIMDATGRTALACAVESGSTETVAALLRAGFENAHAKSSLDITRHSGDPRMSPVYLALARSDTGALEAIIKAATRYECLETLGNALMPPGIGVPPLPPLLWAIKNGKYAHALLLVNAGVNIDVLVDSYHEDGLLDNMKKGSKYIMQDASQRGGLAANGPPGVTRTTHQLQSGRDSAFTLLCRNIWTTLRGSDPKSKDCEEALRLPLQVAEVLVTRDAMDAVVPVQDCYGFSPLHWAVVTQQRTLVLWLSMRANRLRCADTQDTAGWTALHLAADISNSDITQIVLVLGGVSPRLANGDGYTACLLVSGSKTKKELLNNPPPPVVFKPGEKLVIPSVFLKAKSASSSSSQSAWSSFKGLAKLDKKAYQDKSRSPDGASKLQIDSAQVMARKRVTREALYNGFKLAIKAGTAATPLPIVGSGIAVLCTIVDQVLMNLEQVQQNNFIVDHLCDRIKNNLPILNRLRDACNKRANDPHSAEMAQTLLPHIEKLADLFCRVHQVVDEWCMAGMLNMLNRLMSANDFYKDIKDLCTALSDSMLDLNTAISVCKILDISLDNRPRETPDQIESKIKDLWKMQLKLAMRDLLEVEAVEGEISHERREEALEMFKSVGLDYFKIRKAERKKWIQERLQDLVIPHAEVEVSKPIPALSVQGVFTVCEATWAGETVAFKRFFKPSDTRTEQIKEKAENEAFILSQFRHPNIHHLYGLVLRSDRPGPLRNKPSNTFALILEHHPGQTLKDAMKHDDPADAPSLVQRVAWALQIARGMAYLHRRCKEAIVHGALRPSNILIARNGNAVISNFGLARIMSARTTSANGGVTLVSAHEGAEVIEADPYIVYLSPEFIKTMMDGGGQHKRSPSQDVYAFGVLLLELMTLAPFYRGFATTTTEFCDKIAAGQRPAMPEDLPCVLQMCIQQCLQQEPRVRPDFQFLKDMLGEVHNSMLNETDSGADAGDMGGAPNADTDADADKYPQVHAA